MYIRSVYEIGSLEVSCRLQPKATKRANIKDMQSVQVSGEVRENLGKKSSKANRREGLVPAVLYGAGDPVHFTIKALDVRSLSH